MAHGDVLEHADQTEIDMDAHFRLVYTHKQTAGRIISMTHQFHDKVVSMAEMCNRAARFGRFTVEDERGGKEPTS